MKVTSVQKQKLIEIAIRYEESELLKEAQSLIVDEGASNCGIGAVYGSTYIVVLEDGTSHS